LRGCAGAPAGMTGASAFRHEGAFACDALGATGLSERPQLGSVHVFLTLFFVFSRVEPLGGLSETEELPTDLPLPPWLRAGSCFDGLDTEPLHRPRFRCRKHLFDSAEITSTMTRQPRFAQRWKPARSSRSRLGQPVVSCRVIARSHPEAGGQQLLALVLDRGPASRAQRQPAIGITGIVANRGVMAG
jgi:hypothetical protein